MGSTDQLSEPVSSFVAGRKAPVGYVGVEGAPPPLGELYAG